MQEVPITFNGANQTTYVKQIMCLALSTIFTSWLRLQNIVDSSGSKENTKVNQRCGRTILGNLPRHEKTQLSKQRPTGFSYPWAPWNHETLDPLSHFYPGSERTHATCTTEGCQVSNSSTFDLGKFLAVLCQRCPQRGQWNHWVVGVSTLHKML